MTEFASLIAFGFLALAMVGGAAMMTITKNIMHAGFWLLEVSVAAAAMYYLLGADYVAIIQLLVYAGAVSVLVIFSILITTRNLGEAQRGRDLSSAAFVACAVFCVLVLAIILGSGLDTLPLSESSFDLVEFGSMLFSPQGGALPFEISSVVLTVALVAAVWWTGKEEK